MSKTKQCKFCKSKTEVDKGIVINMSFFCSFDHAAKHGIKVSNASKKRQLAKKKKDDRVVMKARKESVKPKSKWLSELQAVFNKYVRLRDINDGCISCDKDKYWQGQWHASHYFSRGHSSALRFNLHNVHKSCSVCNSHLSGNIGEYTPRLIDKIGYDKLEELVKHKSDIVNCDIDWIKRSIKITKKAIKRLEKRI